MLDYYSEEELESGVSDGSVAAGDCAFMRGYLDAA